MKGYPRKALGYTSILKCFTSEHFITVAGKHKAFNVLAASVVMKIKNFSGHYIVLPIHGQVYIFSKTFFQ
jgi:hypothetical protein